MTTARGNFGVGVARTVVILAALLFAAPSLTLALEKDLTDTNICNAVENCFFFDKAVPFDPIDVSCTDGIVTLTGTTNNILAKRRATRLAQTIKGVRAVVNRMKVEPGMDRSGVEIKSDVEAALLSDSATDSYEITVMADEQDTSLCPARWNPGRKNNWSKRSRWASRASAGSPITST